MLDGLHLEGSAAQQLSQLIYNANQILHIFKGEGEREREKSLHEIHNLKTLFSPRL